MKWYRAFTFLFTSIATGLAAAFLVLLLRPDLAGRDAPPPAPRPILLERSGGPVSYADAVQRLVERELGACGRVRLRFGRGGCHRRRSQHDGARHFEAGRTYHLRHSILERNLLVACAMR